jgi:RluA family pseudouridine synthase
VVSGQQIDLFQSEKNVAKVYEFKLSVIFEDEHLAIINKPAGISVSGNQFKTIYNALPFNLKKSIEKDALLVPTPVHRLDLQTSGILVVAKTKTAQIELGKQFERKTINKTYCTIVAGKVINHKTICTPIENKPSETSFEIISTHQSLKYEHLSFLNVFPKTGRTHQIRIHLASIGHPILGDKLYGNTENLLKGKGLFLCAKEISLIHPKTFEKLHFSIEVPRKFNSILIREEKRYLNDN